MKRIITLLICTLLAWDSIADSVKLTVIFEGLEPTEDVAQSASYNMICSMVDPAWQLFISKDSAPFDSLLLKWAQEDTETDNDDPLNILLDYIFNNRQKLFYYSDGNKLYGGNVIELPKSYLWDVANKYGLPSELADSNSNLETRRQSILKKNEHTVMEKLLKVVSCMDFNELFNIECYKPSVQEVNSVAEFSKILAGNEDLNNDTFNKSLYWRNNSEGKYYVKLSYRFTENYESENTNYSNAIKNTLKSLDTSPFLRDHKICVDNDCHYFISSQEYLDKWCFRLISVLYDKLNKLVITDNQGRESKTSIIHTASMNYAKTMGKSNADFPEHEIKTGTSLFNPFCVVSNNCRIYCSTLYGTDIYLYDDFSCNIGFLLDVSELDMEIENFFWYKPHFSK